MWHWISAAFSLSGMLLFSITGLTLNNATWIESAISVDHQERVVPLHLLETLESVSSGHKPLNAPLPRDLESWLDTSLGIRINERTAEIGADEIYLSLPSPGADAWLAVDRTTGELTYEKRERGWIAYFNDLHKGRHAGTGWSWFIDLFAFSCIVFSMSGLLLMKTQAANRPSTWPLLGMGALAPLLIMLLFIH